MVLTINADARAIPLPDRSVQCVITSPPYWGLRDYGVGGQIGLEKTPEEYVQGLVEVFREVRRVLRDDGTVWLNLGDSYASSPPGNKTVGVSAKSGLHGVNGSSGRYRETLAAGHATKRSTIVAGLKPKDLVGIPWRVAFALQAAGWYLRSDIIWAKPNPMPESVTDRPTRSHEYVFLLTKSKKYFYDAEAIKERALNTSGGRLNGSRRSKMSIGSSQSGTSIDYAGMVAHRNRRSVWTITPKPFAGAHFATFPPDLVEPCLLAGTPLQSCADCGAPYYRVIEKGGPRREQQIACGGSTTDGGYNGTAQKDYAAASAQDASATKARILAGMVERRTVGWRASCQCSPAFVAPAIVLDPFGGSGTVGVVANRHDRDCFLLDNKFEYCQLANDRIAGRKVVGERDKQAGHGRRHAGFNERYFGARS